jgi:dUTP pyrophosphatase
MNEISKYQDIPVKYELIHPDAIIPRRGTDKRAYYDIFCIDNIVLEPESVFMARTGLKVQAPPGFFIDVRPRSGLAKKGITVNNSPGVIDCDYGGELIVELIWHVPSEYQAKIIRDLKEPITDRVAFKEHIDKGDRIAQINVMPVYDILFYEGKIKGTEGFGSTGA